MLRIEISARVYELRHARDDTNKPFLRCNAGAPASNSQGTTSLELNQSAQLSWLFARPQAESNKCVPVIGQQVMIIFLPSKVSLATAYPIELEKDLGDPTPSPRFQDQEIPK